MITIKVPGKLMIAGEWAVLEGDKPSIVMAVDKYVECSVEDANHSSIKVPGMDELPFVYEKTKVRFRRILTSGEKEKLLFAKNTIEIFLKFMEENANPINTFRLVTKNHDTTIKVGDMAAENRNPNVYTEKKLGFGSSGAICVAIGTAILEFYDYDTKDPKIKDILFKLSAISHFISQDMMGSCADVASSVYGGVLYYKAFSSLWLKNELKTNISLLDLLEGDWTYLKIRPIKLPKNMKILCCWTSKSSNTRTMMEQMDDFKAQEYEEFKRLMDEIELAVDSVVDAIELGNIEEIMMMLFRNHSMLMELDRSSGIGMLTRELEILIGIAVQNGCVGKISGAGGGDSGIAVCFDDEKSEIIKKAWKEAGLYPIELNIDHDGFKVDK
ncbi:MAG: phosphomevalonate kinase [Candidatus Woesearchaeota archaeon]